MNEKRPPDDYVYATCQGCRHAFPVHPSRLKEYFLCRSCEREDKRNEQPATRRNERF